MSRRAFTLVEAAMSVAIVGILLVASTATFSTIARSRTVQTESRLAFMLGQSLMAEIMQCTFQQGSTSTQSQQLISVTFGPSAGQSRSTFAAVDSYNGYSASPPVTQAGAALPNYTGWTEAVSVSFVDPTTLSASTSSTLKKIVVTITAPSGKQYSLTGMRSLYGVYEVAPTSQMTYVTGVSMGIRGASPSNYIYGGAHPLNITSSQ